ncbi:MAG: hypothetical protein Q8Q60_01685 [Candidatus Chromulinivorax sp.]|nr:hypothetical protein [Candidatus Chromulinivorax sp.]
MENQKIGAILFLLLCLQNIFVCAGKQKLKKCKPQKISQEEILMNENAKSMVLFIPQPKKALVERNKIYRRKGPLSLDELKQSKKEQNKRYKEKLEIKEASLPLIEQLSLRAKKAAQDKRYQDNRKNKNLANSKACCFDADLKNILIDNPAEAAIIEYDYENDGMDLFNNDNLRDLLMQNC